MKNLVASAILILSIACADLEATDTTPHCSTSHPDYYVTVVYCEGELANVDVMCDPTGDITREECVYPEELSSVRHAIQSISAGSFRVEILAIVFTASIYVCMLAVITTSIVCPMSRG